MEEEETWDEEKVMANDFGVITNEGGQVRSRLSGLLCFC